MSHFTTIETQVRDLDALREACAELKVEVLTDTPCRGYARQTRKADVTLRPPESPYDIACDKQENESYALTTDWYQGHVERSVGPEFGRLLQLYGVHKATREAKRRGHRVRRRQRDDGSIQLSIAGGAA